MRLLREQTETEGTESPLSEPHFEEEWTVLSARQVVPIAELEAQAKKRFSLKLVGAFFLASSLGALVALTTIRLRELNAHVAEPEAIPETATSTTINPDTAQANEDATIPAESETTADPATMVDSKPVRVSPRKHERVNTEFEDPESDDNQTESSIESKPQPRLVDQWQEGRPRRVQPSRPKSDGAHHQRDLRDLDEIFEGSPTKP